MAEHFGQVEGRYIVAVLGIAEQASKQRTEKHEK
jgi:hypothetical protein